jgi:cell wall-associated NlpC family hydrolase
MTGSDSSLTGLNGQLSEEQVAQAAYQAGWRGDDLTKIVAIAYRESSGHFGIYTDRPSTGDWSYGLVQLNVGRPDASGQGPMWKSFYSKLPFLHSPDDLRDPVKNLMAAKALFDQSGWRPWGPYKGVSETTGTNMSAAQAAVQSAASHGLLGQDVTSSLHPLTHDDVQAAHPALQTFLADAVAQQGDAYHAGATPSPNDPDPHVFDCSSLVQWAAHQAGVDLARTAEAQYLQLKGMGSTMSVEQALKTPGALLFHLPHEPSPGEAFGPNAHVAISLGDGRTIEAIGSKWGVREVDVASFHTGGSAFFTRAAVIPGISDTASQALPPLPGMPGTAPPAMQPPTPTPTHPDLPPLAGTWRHAPDDVPTPHALPDHLVETVSLPPLPGVDDRAHDRVLPPLAADPQHQPPITVIGDPTHPASTATDPNHPVDPTHPLTTDPAHAASDPSHLLDAAHAAIDPTHGAAFTPSDWAHGHELPGEIHHYDWTSGHPLPGETHLDAHPVTHDVHTTDHVDPHH